MSFKDKDERISCLEAYVTLTSKSSRFTDETEILKMSQRHSGQAGTEAGNGADSPPIVNSKYSTFRDFCSTSSFQDSGYNELKSCSFDNIDKEYLGKKEKGPTLLYEHPETSGLGLTHPLESPTQKKKCILPRKEKDKTPELCETPKISGKKCLPRRRLNVSFALLKGDFESQNSSLESSISQVINLEKNIPSSASGFSRANNFSPLVTSTLKTEEVTSCSQKLRLNFSQQKTSTIDDSKDDCSLFEVECISPIQGNNFKDSITHDFSDSSLCINDENACPELLGSSVSGTTCGTDEDIFVTPISNLVANIRFNASQILSPSPEVRGSISTPEDSGFNSLSLEKSEDSLSDQEGSFQELLQKHKGTPKVGDTIRKTRHLGRSRRLSTLREQSSQSETEEEKQIVHPDSEKRAAAASAISEGQLSSDESGDLTFSLKNLSKTPALQLVHELFMKSKRKRLQENSGHEFLEQGDGEKIAVLQCILAGLIGKKMGIEKLDILTELKYRNLKHILAMVLESLTAESLCRTIRRQDPWECRGNEGEKSCGTGFLQDDGYGGACGKLVSLFLDSVWKVSRNWREIVVQDKNANRRRKFYITQLKTDSECFSIQIPDSSPIIHQN
ncbi:F-box only protein 43 isoform X3 [Homo sapiens]|uniref:F-box only protein 43 isoform X3 n=1 Tax=Homo sapiens TaxID=9606 RepID=UPI0005CFFC0C|nr:F-box only protein 43 isoform X3 [Homo sapiens]XP_047277675.1 F-box only protein 43 isoform X3 [Homo sapiens]XP_054216320.1 F-box only protein 43 isoform X3 [Homo sapiens]XP_054216321.1 F-box only protein 43 isoform X3 [Homo sapiens]|eukprot:XP_011515294.1 F-box only protein 43 isoform X3 [Homo sapiens]